MTPMLYNIIGLVVAAALIFYFTRSKNKRSSKERVPLSSDSPKAHESQKNHYEDLRNMALAITPEQLHISIPPDQTKVFGVVMDLDLGRGIATFVSFETGDASMYLSSGGGIIGAKGRENVAIAAKAFVNKAQSYLDKTARIDTTPLPDKDCVRFYFLTNKGIFTAEERFENFSKNNSLWLPLFEEGNKVITELRMTEEKMQRH